MKHLHNGKTISRNNNTSNRSSMYTSIQASLISLVTQVKDPQLVKKAMNLEGQISQRFHTNMLTYALGKFIIFSMITYRVEGWRKHLHNIKITSQSMKLRTLNFTRSLAHASSMVGIIPSPSSPQSNISVTRRENLKIESKKAIFKKIA